MRACRQAPHTGGDSTTTRSGQVADASPLTPRFRRASHRRSSALPVMIKSGAKSGRLRLCSLPIRHRKSCAGSRTFFRPRCLLGVRQVCLLLIRNQAAGLLWPGGDISQTTLQFRRQKLDRNHRYPSTATWKSAAHTMFFILIVALAFGLALLGPDEPSANVLHFLWR